MKTTSRVFLVCCLTAVCLPPVRGQEQPKPVPRKAWTLDEALGQLRLYPRDAYLQYVVLQLARRENRLNDVAAEVERLQGREDAREVDLFGIFTGALAVQESLQLDTMRGQRPAAAAVGQPKQGDQDTQAERDPRAALEKRRKERVPVASLTGPTTKSHPWEKMLAGRKPEVSPLSKCVPEDYCFAEFRSVFKLQEALAIGDLWGTHLFNQATREAYSHAAGDRLKKQLAIETAPLLSPLYDFAVEGVALASSDLFLREGSDVTFLFRVKQPDPFRVRMDGLLVKAENAGARRTTGEILGVAYTHVASPDRGVHVFSAYPTPNLHVRSNSIVALERVLEAIRGARADGTPVRRLGETPEFAYLRTILPYGAPEEDGFIYLSDPFIRKLVGPGLKLTERRRILCHNRLHMLGHAALLYRAEQGKPPRSLDDLLAASCCPEPFNKDNLACPDGGTYSLAADGLSGICSHHGPERSLRPCCEIPVAEVGGDEADEYKQFLQRYNEYWRTYFDPIALRMQITPQRYRLETVILPLIDNSIYTSVASVLGGKPEPLDALPVPRRSIFSFAARVNKEALLVQAGLTGGKGPAPSSPRNHPLSINNLKQLGLAMHNYHAQYNHFPPAAVCDAQGKPLLSWRVLLLPYLEQDQLFKQFKLDEPWDSEHNKKLLTGMPKVYRRTGRDVKGDDRTCYVAPLGAGNVFEGGPKKTRIADILDGTSNTILLVEVDDEHAVPWTKPEDLKYDPKEPFAGLFLHVGGGYALLYADGSTHALRPTVEKKTAQALFTRAGSEVVAIRNEDLADSTMLLLDLPGISAEEIERLKLVEFLTRGVGNQLGLHIYDSVPMIDVNYSALLGDGLRLMGGGGRRLGSETLLFSFLVSSLLSPVYVSIPVQDGKVVDEFLTRLDALLLGAGRQHLDFGIELDLYHFPLDKEKQMRSYTLRFGPVKWRLCWGRIGNGLYIASKPFILDDLLALESARGKPEPNDAGPAAHAMVRLRPRNWNQVLPDYRLGWAENHREACLHNLGPLSSLARTFAPVAGNSAEERGRAAQQLAERFRGVRFFCPEGGQYMLGDDRLMTCNIHGSGQAPRQPIAPVAGGSLDKLLRDFQRMTMSLTFLEDGLHATVTIERK